MHGIQVLLAGLQPFLHPQKFIFTSFPGAKLLDVAHLDPICTFMEQEGLTAVVTEEMAQEHGLAETSSAFACITITINSSLEAVGLTAAMATELTNAGISANVVAAYHHDHIFVPAARAQDAMNALKALQERSADLNNKTL